MEASHSASVDTTTVDLNAHDVEIEAIVDGSLMPPDSGASMDEVLSSATFVEGDLTAVNVINDSSDHELPDSSGVDINDEVHEIEDEPSSPPPRKRPLLTIKSNIFATKEWGEASSSMQQPTSSDQDEDEGGVSSSYILPAENEYQFGEPSCSGLHRETHQVPVVEEGDSSPDNYWYADYYGHEEEEEVIELSSGDEDEEPAHNDLIKDFIIHGKAESFVALGAQAAELMIRYAMIPSDGVRKLKRNYENKEHDFGANLLLFVVRVGSLGVETPNALNCMKQLLVRLSEWVEIDPLERTGFTNNRLPVYLNLVKCNLEEDVHSEKLEVFVSTPNVLKALFQLKELLHPTTVSLFEHFWQEREIN